MSETTESTPLVLDPKWYALHVLSGQEKKVKDSIEKRIKTEEMSDLIIEVVIPVERVSEVKRGKKIETERKLYPGYVFIHCVLHDQETRRSLVVFYSRNEWGDWIC